MTGIYVKLTTTSTDPYGDKWEYGFIIPERDFGLPLGKLDVDGRVRERLLEAYAELKSAFPGWRVKVIDVRSESSRSDPDAACHRSEREYVNILRNECSELVGIWDRTSIIPSIKAEIRRMLRE